MDEKLIVLVRKCVKKYEYSDSVWKEKLWGQIGEELKRAGNTIILFNTEVLIINK